MLINIPDDAMMTSQVIVIEAMTRKNVAPLKYLLKEEAVNASISGYHLVSAISLTSVWTDFRSDDFAHFSFF